VAGYCLSEPPYRHISVLEKRRAHIGLGCLRGCAELDKMGIVPVHAALCVFANYGADEHLAFGAAKGQKPKAPTKVAGLVLCDHHARFVPFVSARAFRGLCFRRVQHWFGGIFQQSLPLGRDVSRQFVQAAHGFPNVRVVYASPYSHFSGFAIAASSAATIAALFARFSSSILSASHAKTPKSVICPMLPGLTCGSTDQYEM